MSTALKVGLALGGVAVVGGVVYLATRDGDGVGGGRPRGSDVSGLGNLIARFGGSAVASLGSELGNWTARQLDRIFGNSAKQDASGTPPVKTEIFV